MKGRCTLNNSHVQRPLLLLALVFIFSACVSTPQRINVSEEIPEEQLAKISVVSTGDGEKVLEIIQINDTRVEDGANYVLVPPGTSEIHFVFRQTFYRRTPVVVQIDILGSRKNVVGDSSTIVAKNESFNPLKVKAHLRSGQTYYFNLDSFQWKIIKDSVYGVKGLYKTVLLGFPKLESR